MLDPEGRAVNPTAEHTVANYKAIYQQVRENLEQARRKYKEFYDAKHEATPPFKVGDMVWLSRQNISTTRPSTKLDYKRLGPFKITKVVGDSKLAFKLDLPPRMKIHPVFHASLLEPYRKNTISGRTQPPAPPVIVDGEEEWEVDRVLDSRIYRGRLE